MVRRWALAFVDGHIRWQWADGWIQSTVEGVSLLPLGLGQTAMLDSLSRFAVTLAAKPQKEPSVA